MTNKENLAKEIFIEENEELFDEIIKNYKKLETKCDEVIKKIKRKKYTSKVK